MLLPGVPKQVRTPAETGGLVHVVTDAPDGPPTDWIGAYPWLTTDDQLGSYAYGIGGTGFPAKVGWLLNPVSGLTGDLIVSTSSTYEAGSPTQVTIYIHDLDQLTTFGTDLRFDALAVGNVDNVDGSWTVRSRTFEITPEMSAAAAAGRLIVVALIGDDMRLSMLLVEGGAVELHLRQRLRGDARVRNHASRQRSVRVRGYL